MTAAACPTSPGSGAAAAYRSSGVTGTSGAASVAAAVGGSSPLPQAAGSTMRDQMALPSVAAAAVGATRRPPRSTTARWCSTPRGGYDGRLKPGSGSVRVAVPAHTNTANDVVGASSSSAPAAAAVGAGGTASTCTCNTPSPARCPNAVAHASVTPQKGAAGTRHHATRPPPPPSAASRRYNMGAAPRWATDCGTK